jgi:hypothetical protein
MTGETATQLTAGISTPIAAGAAAGSNRILRRDACRAAAERLADVESFLSAKTYSGRPRDARGWLAMTDAELFTEVHTMRGSDDAWHLCLELLTARLEAQTWRSICRVNDDRHDTCRD